MRNKKWNKQFPVNRKLYLPFFFNDVKLEQTFIIDRYYN